MIVATSPEVVVVRTVKSALPDVPAMLTKVALIVYVDFSCSVFAGRSRLRSVFAARIGSSVEVAVAFVLFSVHWNCENPRFPSFVNCVRISETDWHSVTADVGP